MGGVGQNSNANENADGNDDVHDDANIHAQQPGREPKEQVRLKSPVDGLVYRPHVPVLGAEKPELQQALDGLGQ